MYVSMCVYIYMYIYIDRRRAREIKKRKILTV